MRSYSCYGYLEARMGELAMSIKYSELFIHRDLSRGTT